MWLNANVPVIECFLRKEYLYDLDESQAGELVPVTIYGVRSLYGRALGWHVLTKDTGASIWNLPISAFVHDGGGKLSPDMGLPPHYAVEALQLWDCFSYQLSVTEFDHLSGRRCLVMLKNGRRELGNYLFTVDWYGSNYAENAGDGGHKCAHIIELECGLYAAQPNNRILWADPSHNPKPFAAAPDYKTMTRTWHCEHESKWATGEGFFYEVRAGEERRESDANAGGNSHEGVSRVVKDDPPLHQS